MTKEEVFSIAICEAMKVSKHLNTVADWQKHEIEALLTPVQMVMSGIASTMTDPRGFERVVGVGDSQLPTRATGFSAGYDFYAYEDGVVKPHSTCKFRTGVKARMLPNEVLKIYPRSSMGIKYNLGLANTVGIIDSDYYGNDDNDGEILICLRNLGEETQFIKKGDRIAQGIFQKVLWGNDVPDKIREGGIGSTGK